MGQPVRKAGFATTLVDSNSALQRVIKGSESGVDSVSTNFSRNDVLTTVGATLIALGRKS
jgi:hypothetical protein